MGLEIAEQLGWRMPDVILYPTGGGVGLIGIHKALDELASWAGSRDDLPRLVAVQATGCAPIVRAFEAGAEESVKVEDAPTVAFGINVPKAARRLPDPATRCARPAAPPSRSTTPTCSPTSRLAGAARGHVPLPRGRRPVTAARKLRAAGWLVARRRGRGAEHRRRPELPRHRHGRRTDDRQGRRARALHRGGAVSPGSRCGRPARAAGPPARAGGRGCRPRRGPARRRGGRARGGAGAPR